MTINKALSPKKILTIVWLTGICFVLWYLYKNQVPIPQYPEKIAVFVNQFGLWAPIVFILLFAIRPFIFFPATILSLSTGLLFGTSKAILILLIAENLSAFVSYSIGKYFGSGIIATFDTENKIMRNFEKYFHRNDFITILSLRLIFAPFDLVGYVAGASSIPYKSFAIATFLGILPGLLMSAFLGGSIANPYYSGVAVILFVVALVVSRFIKQRHNETSKNI
ncbi:TVP38/TMEM64 family protein [Candidatus Woesebacteria bacterium]|nr:TVP38/TMEM64 family protein [Candidatus Woesebacteria bacterium]